MNAQHAKQIIATWAERIKEIDAAIDELNVAMSKSFGVQIDGEGTVQRAIYKMSDAYTALVASAIKDDGGDRFHDSWLGWYRFECAMGVTPKLAVMPNGEKIMCATEADLLRIIQWGKKCD